MCRHCKHRGKDIDEVPCKNCNPFSTDRCNIEPINNYHRIKAMSVEQLARFIATPCECEVDPETDGYVECGNDLCIQRLIKWLESEV